MLHSLLTLALLPAAIVAEERIHGVVMFHRHGDRTSKVQGNAVLTVTGQNQLFNSGSYWRSRYLNTSSPQYINGINTTEVQASQLTAMSPDDAVLVMSGEAFLQGFYPPTSSDVETLANKSTLEAPLSGYQYAHLSTIQDDSAETLAIKGDDPCPAYVSATDAVPDDPVYKARVSSTSDFYQSFYDDILSGVFNKSQVSYDNAYTIFDYINVMSVHNDTVRKLVEPTSEDMLQLRTLADSHEWLLNGNISTDSISTDINDPRAVGGRTLAHQILEELETTIASEGKKNKFSVMFGSYDTFLAFFGLTDLYVASSDFYGLPDYGSAMAFELFTNTTSTDFPTNSDDLLVRFVFRNGTTQGDAQEYPLFGRSAVQTILSWVAFKDYMGSYSISSTAQWCDFCGADSSNEVFCNATDTTTAVAQATVTAHASSKLSSPAAGVVGAVCALGVCALAVLGMAFAGFRVRRRRDVQEARRDSQIVVATEEKGSFNSA